MSEHRRGVDEAEVVRALQRAGSADTGVDVSALAAGARGRARSIRRRRQGVAGVVAVFALAVPIGISQWPGQVNSTVTPASPTAQVASSIPDSALLTTEQVTAVVPGLVPGDQLEATTNSGFCQDDAYEGATTVVDAHRLTWSGTESVVDSPTPDNAQADVLLFRGTAATDWMALTSQDAQDCTTDAPEGGEFTLVDANVTADEVVAGYAPQTLSDNNPSWTAIVVARTGQLVVRVNVATHQSDGQAAVDQAAQLAAAQLEDAADLVQAGGAAR